MDLNIAVHTISQSAVRIGDLRAHMHGMALRIHTRSDAQDVARKHFAGECRCSDVCRLPGMNAHQIFLIHIGIYPDRICIHNGHHLPWCHLRLIDGLAGIRETLCYYSAYW